MGEEYPHTHTHTGLRSVKQKGSICFSALWASRKKEEKKPSHWHFTSIRRSVKEEWWRSPPLDKLTCSAGKYSCLALLPRLPSSQTLSGAKSHSSIFLHGAYTTQSASFCFCIRNTTSPGPVTHSLFHWVMMGSIWTQLFIFFNSRLFMQENSAWARFYLSTKIQKSCTFAICNRELPSTTLVLAKWCKFKALLKWTLIIFSRKLNFKITEILWKQN